MACSTLLLEDERVLVIDTRNLGAMQLGISRPTANKLCQNSTLYFVLFSIIMRGYQGVYDYLKYFI